MMGRILGVNCDHCSNLELVSLQFPGSPDVQQGVWLIGTFVAEVWEKIFIRGAPRLKKEQFFGFLKFSRMALGSGSSFWFIPELSQCFPSATRLCSLQRVMSSSKRGLGSGSHW